MKKILIGLTSLLFASLANATPITYNYSGTWTSFNSGDFASTYSIDAIFDNGGSTIENQIFVQADLLSVTAVSGSYSNTWLASDITSWSVNFFSDAIGKLNSGWANLSNIGGSFHFDPNWPDANISTSSNGSAGYFSDNQSNIGTIAVSVPEPTSIALLALGVAGFGFAKRKKSA